MGPTCRASITSIVRGRRWPRTVPDHATRRKAGVGSKVELSDMELRRSAVHDTAFVDKERQCRTAGYTDAGGMASNEGSAAQGRHRHRRGGRGRRTYVLAKLGFAVVASTGRPAEADYLKSLGTARSSNARNLPVHRRRLARNDGPAA